MSFNRHTDPVSYPHFDQVYLQYWRELYEVAYRRLERPADAEDLVQEVFIALLKNPQVLQREGSLRAYLHRAIKGKIIDYYRRSLLKDIYTSQKAATGESFTTNAEDDLQRKELEALLEVEISKMPERMKAVFLLSRYRMFTNEEIAAELSMSDQTVRNQISAAIKRLRLAFRRYNLIDDTGGSVIMILAALLLEK